MAIACPPWPSHFIDAPTGPRMHRGVHIREGELIGRELTVRVHVPFAQEQHKLLLGKVWIKAGQGEGVESEIPGGVPGVFPLVWHGDDITVEEMLPVVIAPVPAVRRRCRVQGIPFEPVLDHIVEELLGPEEASIGLAHHLVFCFPKSCWDTTGIETVGLTTTLHHYAVEVSAEYAWRRLMLGIETQSEVHFTPGWHLTPVVERCFRAACRRINRRRLAMHDVGIESVFDIGGRIGQA